MTVSIALYIAGVSDRSVEQLLVESGLRVTRISADDMEAMAVPGAPQPDAVVLDLRRDRRILPLVALLRSHHPTTPLLAVVPALDTAFMLEGMRAGINECVGEPLQRAEFNTAIRRLIDKRPTAASGAIFGFLGAKGGVGSTTLAVNIAAAVSQVGQVGKTKGADSDAPSKTLLADLHLMYGDCALFLGAEPRFSIADVLENGNRFDQAFLRGVVARHPGGPDLLGSSSQLKSPSTDLHRIETLLELARMQYAHTFLDLPRSDSGVLDALSAITAIVIVVNQDVATLRAARAIGTTLRQRYGAPKVRFVLNRHDPRAEITARDVEDAIGEAVAAIIPSDYRTAVQAVNSGIPVVMGWPGTLAAAIKTFAVDLTGVAVPANARPERPRLLGRLAAMRSLFA
jgi:pilus assembly protein CpaE